MTSPSLRGRRIVAVAVLAGLGLALVPPAAGAPRTRLAEERVDLTRLAPTAAARAGNELRLTAGRWSDQAKVCAPFRFTMVGFTWRGADHADVGVTYGGGYTRLLGDEHEGPDPGSEEYSGIVGTAPLWLGDERCVFIRVRSPEGEPLRGLRAVFIDTKADERDTSILGSIGRGLSRAWAGLGNALAPPPAEAWTTRPGIVTRAKWGANESWRNCGPNYMDRVDVAYVHHTATGNKYSKSDVPGIVRGIYRYHTKSLNYCDIAYNFLIDKFGRVFEGRFGGINKNVQGGHAAGFNTRTVGISAIGDYSSKTPEKPLLRSFRRLIAWRLDIAHVRPASKATLTSSSGSGTSKYSTGTKVTMVRVVGHRRTSYTACPGNSLANRVKNIRNGADRIGHPKVYLPKASATQVVHGQNSVTFGGKVSTTSPRWFVDIFDPNGDRIRRFRKDSKTISATWDGKVGGIPVPDGDYRAKIWARFEKKDARPAWFTIRVCAVPNPSTGVCPAP